MSLSSAMNIAVSGLAANSRASEVVAGNVANALTEDYARRSLSLSSVSLGGTGGGVRVDGVSRQVDPAVLTARRGADAAVAGATVRGDFYAGFETALGLPGEPGALTTQIAGLKAALLDAASRPDSDAGLQAVLDAAADLAEGLNALSDHVQDARLQADAAIADQVATLNANLQRIDSLNTDIVTVGATGGDPSALMDERQRLIDEIAVIVPLREVPGELGQVTLYSEGGLLLLDNTPVTFGFDPAGTVTEAMTVEGGALSGLTVNGQAISTGETGLIGGGALSAGFAVRDDLAVEAQAQLDAIARDLVERLAAADPTLAPGAGGLLTDGGAAFDSLNEAGLSARIAVNPLADPAQGGDLWRIRDGLGAAAEGEAGQSALLLALADALAAEVPPASGAFTGTARSAGGLAAELLSQVSGDRLSAEDDLTVARSQRDAFAATLARNGVDTDAEMQALLLIERAYAANAQVISAIDEMLQRILEI
ncbi:flagellar hook-associated protein FlgK [Frigidibacter oleivorans]|uniref:flagellar hook-associated protein FlgK n=1 Tax=Frigidibacter oleivorans TaxID=2487129 RepID=UPI000F8DF085|nr:flagellar hook-associated protein FlgK [Frigidibacter oleivorans]